jgi:hypothetical protein
MLRAAATPAVARLLAASAATGMSHTGNTNETALATISIPGGAMGLNGGLLIYTTWTYTNSGNNKTLRVRFGGASGTQYLASTTTTTATLSDFRKIRNRNSASAQIGNTAGGAGSTFGTTASAVTTSSVDTTAAVDLVISAQLASAGETITLESYEVWLLP